MIVRPYRCNLCGHTWETEHNSANEWAQLCPRCGHEDATVGKTIVVNFKKMTPPDYHLKGEGWTKRGTEP